MDTGRKPLQGILNIIRFNWPYYVWGIGASVILALISFFLSPMLQTIALILALTGILLLLSSTIVSLYVYDFSRLYRLEWLPDLSNKSVLVVNAGFDEISQVLLARFPGVRPTTCDFYDPLKHSEPSIKRARAAFPPIPGTLAISTSKLPFESAGYDYCIAFLSVHEIRDFNERVNLIREINRVLHSKGGFYITEHLRDVPNFLAYSIGFFHFHSRKVWINTFLKSGFQLTKSVKTTPFITTFILHKYVDPY